MVSTQNVSSLSCDLACFGSPGHSLVSVAIETGQLQLRLLLHLCGCSRGWGGPLRLTHGLTDLPIFTASIVSSRQGDNNSQSWGCCGVLIHECLESNFSKKILSVDPGTDKAPPGGPRTYQSTSKPLLATTRAGICRVCRGSTSPSVGLMAREPMPKTGIFNRGYR